MVYWILKNLFGPIVRLFWIKKVEGLNNIPKNGACIIAANHSSYLDFFSLTAVCPRRIRFLAAEKFFQGKIWGPLVKLTGQIKVDRHNPDKSNVYETILSILKQNKIIGIFPEGTRSRDNEIHKTYTGVAMFSLTAKVPIIPIGISGAFKVLPPHKKFPKFKKSIEIKIGQPVEFKEYYGKENDEKIFREITDKIMLKIAALAGK